MQFLRSRKRKTPVIGMLELEVLKRLWAAPGALDARSIQESHDNRAVSLSTIQATLERLHRKDLLERTKISRAYFYTPALTREQLIATLIGDVATRLAEGELEPVISGFIEFICDSDPALLDRLQSDARRRRERE